MAYRWSKSLSAYNKWKHIFDNTLPMELTCEKSNALSTATYIRDIITFANEHDLKGSHWYKTVMITALDEKTLLIRPKRSDSIIAMSTHPNKNVFDLLGMAQDKTLKIGYTFYTPEDVNDLLLTMQELGILFIHKGQGICEITSITNSGDNNVSSL